MQQPPVPEPKSNNEPKSSLAPMPEPRPADAPHYDPQPESSYIEGYRQAPPQYYPPPQSYPPQQYQPYPPQPYPMQPPPVYMQPPYPYQQQMMQPQMMPPQIVINNNVSQVNTPIAVVGKQQINIWVRIIYFFFIGLPLGSLWAMIAALFCCTFIGLGIGLMMFRALPAIFTLQR